jgi:hypothetical protein
MSKVIKTFAITTIIGGSAFAAATTFEATATSAVAQYAGYGEFSNEPYYNVPNEGYWRCNCTGRSQQQRAF